MVSITSARPSFKSYDFWTNEPFNDQIASQLQFEYIVSRIISREFPERYNFFIIYPRICFAAVTSSPKVPTSMLCSACLIVGLISHHTVKVACKLSLVTAGPIVFPHFPFPLWVFLLLPIVLLSAEGSSTGCEDVELTQYTCPIPSSEQMKIIQCSKQFTNCRTFWQDSYYFMENMNTETHCAWYLPVSLKRLFCRY